MADPIEDILDYDPRRPFQGATRDPDVYGDLSIKPFSSSYSHRGLSPSLQVEALQHRAPESKQYGRSIFDMLPESLSKEIQSYNRRTPVDLISNALAQSFGFPTDLVSLISEAKPEHRSDLSPYKGLDRDEYPAGSMREFRPPAPVSTDPNRITPRRSSYQPSESDDIARRQAEQGMMPTGRMPSEPMALTTEHLKNLLKEYGITSNNELPVAQFISDFIVPMGGTAGVRAAGRKINEIVPNMRRSSTPVTATLEGVAPDLGQRGDDAFKELITDRLIGGKGSAIDTTNFAGQPSTINRGYGAWKKETNPLVAVDVPNIPDISQSPEFIRAMNQTGSSLNQEGMAAHRFLPHPINTRGGANSMLLKPQFGDLSREQFLQLHKLLDGSGLAFTHNPKLGGAVVFPFDEVTAATQGKATDLFKKAMNASDQVLGGNASPRFGKSDYYKDRFYAETPYAGYTPNQDVLDIRDFLKGMEDAKFPK